MLPQDPLPPKAAAPKLLVDAMLGRLAKWLRLLGYDTEYWRDGPDEALIAHAQAEGRLIVTRDHGLAGRRGVWALLIHAEDLDGQIAELREVLGGAVAPFTRCAECNGPLLPLAHAEARGLVPPYVWHTQHEFRRCQGCGRVYWKGSHWPALRERLTPEE
ncbi:MAG: Mut7-C RNAse domain-containing protein [Anaerolineae bacterium]